MAILTYRHSSVGIPTLKAPTLIQDNIMKSFNFEGAYTHGIKTTESFIIEGTYTHGIKTTL